MTAVSQSYPNYLGGLNEQPDELMKPGQVVEALNVIPDPVIGLTRRPGFEKLQWSYNNGSPLTTDEIGIDATGTWFEVTLTNQVNNDYLYIGCVNPDGRVQIFNQDGAIQPVKYTGTAVEAHKKYEYYVDDNGDQFLNVYEEDEVEPLQNIQLEESAPLPYFSNEIDKTLKYCVSKEHIVFTNPREVPTLNPGEDPSTEAQSKYYSFVNLKALDYANYNYTLRRYYQTEDTTEYTEIADIDISSVGNIRDNVIEDDLTLPLQQNSPYRMDIDVLGTGTERAIVDVYFSGYVEAIEKKNEYINKVVYYTNVKVIDPGKGFETKTYTETLDVTNDLPNAEPGVTYELNIKFDVSKVNTITTVSNDVVVPGGNTGLGTDPSVTDILTALRTEFTTQHGIDSAIIVGNGLYLEHSEEFSISTDEIAVVEVINSQKLDDDLVPMARVNSTAELPTECYPGFVVQVKNSFDESGDYYLEYVSESYSDHGTIDENGVLITYDILKSDGYWEEIAKPYEPYNPNSVSLPHIITIAKERDSTEFAFVVSPMVYEPRTAGSSDVNPSMFTDGTTITSLNYYKNRLFFFTDSGNVLSSQAGIINNLFIDTALTTSTIDPLDIVANSNQRVALHGSAVVNNSMVIFGESEQYSLTTDVSVLSPETVTVSKISNYTFDKASNPVFLGPNLGFVSSGMSRFYELTNIYDRGPVDINERSQQIQTQFGQGFNMPVSSREQSMVLFYKKFRTNDVYNDFGLWESAGDNSKDLYMYRFRQENSQVSKQTSWVKWTIDDVENYEDPRVFHQGSKVAYVSMPRDKVFIVMQDGIFTKLYRMEGTVVEGLPASSSSGLDAVPHFTDGYTIDSEGVYTPGFEYESRIVFPTIYPRGRESYDITSNVTIHRVKLSTAAVGAYNLKIDRYGYDSYEVLVEQTPADNYMSHYPQLRGEHIETVPVYTRNKNLNLTLTSKFDAPFTLQSMTWEGDWNTPYYRRV